MAKIFFYQFCRDFGAKRKLTISSFHPYTTHDNTTSSIATICNFDGGCGGCSVFRITQFDIVAILLIVSACLIQFWKGEIVSFHLIPKFRFFSTKSFFPQKTAKGYHQGFFGV